MDVYLKRLKRQGEGDLDHFQVFNHTSSQTLAETETGSTHTNYGATGTITLTPYLKSNQGHKVQVCCKGTAQQLRIKVSSTGEVYRKWQLQPMTEGETFI